MKNLHPQQILNLFLNGDCQEREELYKSYSLIIDHELKNLIVSIGAEFDLLPIYRRLGVKYTALKLENGNIREYEIEKFSSMEATREFYKNNVYYLNKLVNESNFKFEDDTKQLIKLLNKKYK